ncbi:hypothetical protein BU23DRAFT_603640 [Bimuria novae-zelandiae CBS 107.79]|uniref:Aminoglycoside phosphotransferase domain-containing protein n=1 Tax=Bimuria novae-zelandiae CBS 107.79 TaxID=1447943 RepID=A0A6A5UQW1_9PLEO|nr:hypothetical protein BU23DRAFT_603640 [Bimuria novae-zelandiae CBS 107.79]
MTSKNYPTQRLKHSSTTPSEIFRKLQSTLAFLCLYQSKLSCLMGALYSACLQRKSRSAEQESHTARDQNFGQTKVSLNPEPGSIPMRRSMGTLSNIATAATTYQNLVRLPKSAQILPNLRPSQDSRMQSRWELHSTWSARATFSTGRLSSQHAGAISCQTGSRPNIISILTTVIASNSREHRPHSLRREINPDELSFFSTSSTSAGNGKVEDATSVHESGKAGDHQQTALQQSTQVPTKRERGTQTTLTVPTLKEGKTECSTIISDSTANTREARSDEQSEEKSEDERKDWNSIRALPEEKYVSLVRDSLLRESKDTLIHQCTVVGSRGGSFHHAVIVVVVCKRKGDRMNKSERYVVRVPAHGVASLWRDEDKYMMRREVELLRLIHHHTKVPVPRVVDFCDDLDSLHGLGAPWILMEMLPGDSAVKVWYDAPYKYETAYLTADVPSPETHRKRVNLLSSLASCMAELQKLEFDAIGMPQISDCGSAEDPTKCGHHKTVVSHSFHWPYTEDIHKVVRHGPFASTQGYIEAAWKHSFGPDRELDVEEDHRSMHGACKILEMVFDTAPFHSKSETFVIRHNDLDLQNILTNKDGFVTGIIDWDGAYAAPRCVGTAAVPRWLMHDWFPSDDDDEEELETRPHMAWATDYYRKIYAAAMYAAEQKQGLSIDAKYTSKSPLYLSALSCLYEGGELLDFTKKVLQRIPTLTANADSFRRLLGGWPYARAMLSEEIAKLCEPELPDAAIFCELREDFNFFRGVEGFGDPTEHGIEGASQLQVTSPIPEAVNEPKPKDDDKVVTLTTSIPSGDGDASSPSAPIDSDPSRTASLVSG